MPSFLELVEKIESYPLQDNGSTKSAAVYAKQNPDFWQHLANLANSDSKGLANMLGMSPAHVATWYRKIQHAAKLANQMTAEKQKTLMLPTGNNE